MPNDGPRGLLDALGAQLAAGGLKATAVQQIGGASGNGVLRNSTVVSNGAINSAGGILSTAEQRIGVAR